MPQSSIFRRHLCNIFINDLVFFVFKPEICTFADENIPVVLFWKRYFVVLSTIYIRFQLNSLKPRPGKFQFMILGKKDKKRLSLYLNVTEIERSHEVVFAGVTVSEVLNFKKLLSGCKR